MKKAGKAPQGGTGKKKSHRVSNTILVLILLAGIAIAAYPAFSDYWNSMHQTRAIQSYAERVAEMDNEEYTAVWEAALDYNRRLAENPNPWAMEDEDIEDYERQLNVDGTGNMGFISIPKIDVNLPLYHGTSDAVLQTSIGHIDGTSLPAGSVHPDPDDFSKVEYASHSVLSGHRGLPSAKLFSDLDAMEVGDVFYLTILDQTLTYQVDKISVILPEDSSELSLFPGKDYCTLMTCTPYGINTHRLLVRGVRVENDKELLDVRVTADALKVEPLYVVPFIAAPVLLLLILWVVLFPGKKKRR
ncbi:class C sortase [Aristaeella lactis]|uniref:Sortase A n=1 Tax=Aristaeella lactis TaxID=3046383 RepID=A0AC61PQU4_9FIRM|nr:class C sortase [Aristaeella lactis]QUA54154.1 class C sortase [Aristaeella lactis]SMC93840.1 sortase A [Aristaeella lactis]